MSDMRFSSRSDWPHVLPGEDLIEAGIRDLHDSRETIEALLVCDRGAAFATLGNRAT